MKGKGAKSDSDSRRRVKGGGRDRILPVARPLEDANTRKAGSSDVDLGFEVLAKMGGGSNSGRAQALMDKRRKKSVLRQIPLVAWIIGGVLAVIAIVIALVFALTSNPTSSENKDVKPKSTGSKEKEKSNPAPAKRTPSKPIRSPRGADTSFVVPIETNTVVAHVAGGSNS